MQRQLQRTKKLLGPCRLNYCREELVLGLVVYNELG